MTLKPLYTCSRCKKEFNFDNVKYDNHRSLVCVGCLGNQKELNKKELDSEKPDEIKTIKLICLQCRFKYSVRKGSPKSLKCPYCGKINVMIVKKYKDENDLIEDSMNPKFDN